MNPPREGAMAASKCEGTVHRIVAFGDSTTAPREKTKTYSDWLAESFPRAEVLNKGVRGNSTAAASDRFQEDVGNQRPDVVIIQFGINDAAVDVWKTPPATGPRVALRDFETNVRRFVTESKSLGARVILMTPNQLRWRRKLVEMYGRPPYDPDAPDGFTRILAAYAAVVRDLAKEFAVPLVDVYAWYDEAERKNVPCESLIPDGMHPSGEAHAWVAEQLIPILREFDASTR